MTLPKNTFGGKPSKGTPADRRLSGNKGLPPKAPKVSPPTATTKKK